jgi:hypothetical protein
MEGFLMYKRVNINEKYIKSISEELATLDDCIPMGMWGSLSKEYEIERWEFLKDHPEIRAQMKEQRHKYRNLPHGKDINFLYEETKKFVDKYPQWSEIIESVDDI